VPGGSESVDADEKSLQGAVYGRRGGCFVLFMDGVGVMLLYHAMDGLSLVSWRGRVE
jgi:hypothetical protein